MANEENLKPGGEAHKLTDEERSRGGKKGKIAKSLAQRKYCRSSCPIYPCPFVSMSEAFKDKEDRDKAPCALKQLSYDIQRHTINLLKEGREGAVKEYANLIVDLFTKSEVDNTWEKKVELVDKLSKFVKDVYGKKLKQKVEQKRDGDVVTAQDFADIYDEVHGDEEG